MSTGQLVGGGIGLVLGIVLSAVGAGPVLGMTTFQLIYTGFMVGYTIGGIIDPPKTDYPRSPIETQDLTWNTFQKNYPVPIVYGRTKVYGEIMWIGNTSVEYYENEGESGGSGGDDPPSQYIPYYKADFAMCLSEGPIERVLKVWWDEQEIIDDELADLGWTYATGTPTQTANSHVLEDTTLNSWYPTWRNTAYLMASGSTGKRNRVPIVAALVDGLLVDNDGGANPASVVLDFLSNTRYGCSIPFTNIDTVSFTEVGSYCDVTVTNSIVTTYNIGRVSLNSDMMVVLVAGMFGAETNRKDMEWLSYAKAGDTVQISDWLPTTIMSIISNTSLILSGGLPAWQASTWYNQGDWIYEDGYYFKAISSGNTETFEPTWNTTVGAWTYDLGVVWECQTSEALDYVITTSTAEKRFAVQVFMNSRKSALDWLKEILSSFRGYLVWSDSKIRLRVEKDVDPDDCLSYDEDSIIEDSFTFQEVGTADKYNKVEIDYIDRKDSQYRHDVFVTSYEYRQEVTGETRPLNFSTTCVQRQSQIARMAAYLIDMIQICTWRCRFRTDIVGMRNEPGDVIKVTHSTPNWTDKLFRIVKISEAEEDEYEFECVEYNAYVYNDADPRVDAGASAIPINYFTAPENVARLNARLLPYSNNIEVLYTLSSSPGYYSYSIIQVKKPGSSDYVTLPDPYRGTTASAYLDSDLSSSGNEVYVCGVLDTPPASGTLVIDNEEMTYTEWDDDNMKFTGVVRGVNGTSAQAHTANQTTIPLTAAWNTEGNSLIDRVAFFNTTAQDIEYMSVNSNTVYVGFDSKPHVLRWTMATVPNTSVIPKFYYYSSSGECWRDCIVTDTTSGFVQSGHLIIEIPDNSTEWDTYTVVTTTAYYLKMQRTSGDVSVTPKESIVTAGSGTKVMVKYGSYLIPFDPYTETGTWWIRAIPYGTNRMPANSTKSAEVPVYVSNVEEKPYTVSGVLLNNLRNGEVVFP